MKTSSEPRYFDLETVGSKGKVYYESYFYIVATGTATRRSEKGVVIEEELVLDVPQGKAVILTKKVHKTFCIHVHVQGAELVNY